MEKNNIEEKELTNRALSFIHSCYCLLDLKARTKGKYRHHAMYGLYRVRQGS
jgi:hypothetical protein